MSKIAIEGMEFFSYHGHFEEESVIGTNFILDLEFETDTSSAEVTDRLEETVNYLSVYLSVKKQMEKSSLLIENVARRIVDALFEEYSPMESIKLKFTKVNPPLGGKMKGVSITLNEKRPKVKKEK